MAATLPTLLASLSFFGLQAGDANLVTAPGQKSRTCAWMRFGGKPVSSPSLQGETVFSVAGSPYGMTGAIEGFRVRNPPSSRRLRLSISLRGSEPGQTFDIVGFATNSKAQPRAEDLSAATTPNDRSMVTRLSMTAAVWEQPGTLRADKWSHLQYDWSLPPGADELRVILHNPNKRPIFMSAPRLEAGSAMPPSAAAVARGKGEVALYLASLAHPFVSPVQQAADEVAKHPGPVVAHVLVRVPVRTMKAGEVGHVTFPVPALCDGQVPLAFRVVQSSGKVLGFKWLQRKDKRNWVCEVAVCPGTKGVFVQCEALVLLGGPHSRDLAPPTDSDWKSSTACVQVSAPEIQEVAQKLAAAGDSDEAYARKVFAFVRDDMGKGAPFKTLDALAGLQCGGSCTNKANLVAALLRAHGMTARTVCHMPTWCKMPLDYHWLTEYWQPGEGWIAVDSALGRWDPDRRTRMVLNVAGREDEDRAFEPLHERFVMPGAPYQSVAEFSKELYVADITQEDALNSGDQVARFEMTPSQEAALFEEATASYQRLLRELESGRNEAGRYERALQLAKAGKWQSIELRGPF